MTKLTYAMVAALSSGLLACGNDCDDADERARAKYEGCGIDLGEARDSEAVEQPVCTENRERARETFARCVEDASCEAIRGEDAAGYARYAACLGGE